MSYRNDELRGVAVARGRVEGTPWSGEPEGGAEWKPRLASETTSSVTSDGCAERSVSVAIAPGERRQAGGDGEEIARAWLEAAGWEIVDQNVNFRCGELDLVARDRDQIVFVEVRSRWTHRGGTGAHSVGRTKQQRLTRAAQLYLQRRGWTRVSARFDAISVDLQTGCVVEHFRGAFDACER